MERDSPEGRPVNGLRLALCAVSSVATAHADDGLSARVGARVSAQFVEATSRASGSSSGVTVAPTFDASGAVSLSRFELKGTIGYVPGTRRGETSYQRAALAGESNAYLGASARNSDHTLEIEVGLALPVRGCPRFRMCVTAPLAPLVHSTAV